MNSANIPKWIKWVALLVLLGQLGSIGLMLAGRLHGSQRNLVPQALIAGAAAYFVLAVSILVFHSDRVPAAPARLGILLLIVLALGLCGLYFVRFRPIFTLPYDLGGWSETFYLTDIIKWRAGARLYLPPDDSNSGVYTFLGPALTYLLAWLTGHPASIVAFRFLQQCFLIVAAVFAGASAWNLMRIAEPERARQIPRLWLPFFALTSFLIATNQDTNTFNIYLHHDSIGILVSALGFWALAKYALTQSPRWLGVLAVFPAVGFLAKQYLAVFAAVYVVFLWLDGKSSLRRVITFGVVSFGILGATMAAGFVIWGANYRYWVFEIMGSHVVSFERISERFADSAAYVVMGLAGGLLLLRGSRLARLLPLWAGWVVMTLAGLYSSGITYVPTHLGPASVVGGCFLLAALALLWPSAADSAVPSAQHWLSVCLGLCAVFAVFAALGFTRKPALAVTPDLDRYVKDIEREFEGLPTQRVLLDIGDWIYLQHNVLMKDRLPILVTHRTPHFGLVERVRRQEYARILVHMLSDGNFLYDIGGGRGLTQELLARYHVVRRIPGVRGMENWRYYNMSLNEISVLEPIPPGPSSGAGAAPAAAGGTR